ncbi:class I SAM-dependent methyltransferase [Paenibacillus sacheonensis]|uniref:Methyltransferase domain-containing protein n=1 Tax=Paenibacillus sacheonensis TaxID=742054 RepID=A0A7X4YK33_9BACL|nr:class I SAM-dependent methyltransferase [Paenibacillus sacheonensis]MBM7563900.1 SAM-dependent methyltransferase [Paenibacillus sacheonensis]NBC67753.1 methyltransferase domain-containing protein [Paenibacillus sacheonensis]
MEPYYWDEQIEYLKTSTSLFYNDDYIEFLVERLWRIDRPVRVVDFGCGYGHLGIRLLPLLPEGSEYVGIDAGIKLIEHARKICSELPYRMQFFTGDVHHFDFTEKYDLAVCHALLLHMNDPIAVLNRMADCVKKEGRVIAFEPHWIGTNASFHFDGLDQSAVIPLGQLQALFERDAQRTGKDGNIGLKLPLYFNRIGLSDVQCRVSDKVNIYDPSTTGETRMYEGLRFNDPGERISFTEKLLARGMSEEEANRQYECEKMLSERFTPSMAATYAAGMKITFGTV